MKLALAALALLTTQAHAEVFKSSDWVIDTPASLTIRSDGGGSIDDYAEMIASMGSREVRIVGVCKSACTMFLGLENVCVSPDASFGFHGPSSKNQSIAYLTELVHKIAKHHPEPIAALFTSEWGMSTDYTWLTGEELMHLVPSLQACK